MRKTKYLACRRKVGKSDILWSDSSGVVPIWFMNGTQDSSSASVATVDTTWVIEGLNTD
jgi:hypothetical protein